MVESRPAHIVDRASFGVERVQNQTFSTVYGSSRGSEEECSRILDKTTVEVAQEKLSHKNVQETSQQLS